MNYSPISTRERLILEELETEGPVVFTPDDVIRITGDSPEDTFRALSRMQKKGLVVRLERGKYVIGRFASELDIYDIAPHMFTPSYLSFWSGLHFYGWTEQVPTTVFLAVSRARRPVYFQGRVLRFVKLREDLFFGYQKVGRTVIAKPEKLIVDCLLLPGYCGGVSELRKALRDGEFDTSVLVEYAVRTRNRSLCSRLGYLLEAEGLSFESGPLDIMRSRCPILLDPSAPRGEISRSRRWNVKVNEG